MSTPGAELKALVLERIQHPAIAAAGLTHRDFVPLPDWIAELILRAIREGHLDLQPHPTGSVGLGYLGSLTELVTGGRRHASVYWTADASGRSRSLAPEAALSIAAAAQLVLDLGYLVETVEIESKDYAFDVMAYRDPGSRAAPLLAVEAKVLDTELDLLVAGMVGCLGLGTPASHLEACREANLVGSADWENHHRKCLGMLNLRPRGFWPVSYGRPDRYAFIVRVSDRRFELEPVLLADLSFATLSRAA
jgi:hypothetical protein